MSLTRRRFLAGLALASLAPAGCSSGNPVRRNESALFKLGVASGDPLSSGMVLWTRIASLDDADASRDAVEVAWTVARDPEMLYPVKAGRILATPSAAHCVHVEVDGLQPNTRYYYCFDALGDRSPIGRTKTLPASGVPLDEYNIAVVSCQNYSEGYFTPYSDIVARDPDLIIHLGDYIYETGGGTVRPYPVDEAVSLADYRALYSQYRLDESLQEAHRLFPWILIWDDHEVVNDWGPRHYLPSSHNTKSDSVDYLTRKDAAIRAYFEYMPMRQSRKDHVGNARIYDRTVIGDLVELNRLDVRSYRDEPVCELNERRHFEPCESVNDADRSLMGDEQEKWLIDGLGSSGARWKCLVQATVMAPLDLGPGAEVRYEADSWDNYEATRRSIVNSIANQDLVDVVSFGGNIHAFYAGVVYDNQWKADRKAVLTEIVATSIAAPGGGVERFDDINGRLNENPSIHYFENRYRGYVWLDFTHSDVSTELRVAESIESPDSRFSTLKSFKILSGKPGLAD